ncbi:hypothetical protein LPU83_pLPU83d_1030 (plasmid) [Rhizobium favelukesii]|uniref:Uncharacterized protein n=1 Tax=Rhizobium favelukesii TaxID=348824 RepID=W6RQF1_9HYPH|nr:hypothetical protein LPU83_pLPU83d_1030 [Rhizobium favelukesii]
MLGTAGAKSSHDVRNRAKPCPDLLLSARLKAVLEIGESLSAQTSCGLCHHRVNNQRALLLIQDRPVAVFLLLNGVSVQVSIPPTTNISRSLDDERIGGQYFKQDGK